MVYYFVFILPIKDDVKSYIFNIYYCILLNLLALILYDLCIMNYVFLSWNVYYTK